MFPALHTCIPKCTLSIYVYNLNKETQQTNTQTCGEGEGEGGGNTSFFLLNPRYLVFVLEVSMQEGDFAGEKSSRCRGKFGTTYYYLPWVHQEGTGR